MKLTKVVQEIRKMIFEEAYEGWNERQTHLIYFNLENAQNIRITK